MGKRRMRYCRNPARSIGVQSAPPMTRSHSIFVSGTMTIWYTVSSFWAPPASSGVSMIFIMACSSIFPFSASHNAIRFLRRVSPSQEADRNEFTIHTRTADDKFERLEEGRVMYRLYTPEAQGPRPLILFLHGGGNGGYEGERDNNKHIVTDYGPVNFAENYPDVYVMAPMAVEARRDMSKFNPNIRFAESDAMNVPGFGWCREYLGQVCDIIRRMISEGRVDGKRVYVTGMSMGGAGTIRAMSVASDLFAACVPICPSMSPETFSILKSMRRPVWVASAYIDHTLYRHKYLVDAVMALRDSGNSNAHLTLFAPEDLEKYDVAITPDLPYPRLFGENHASWIPTYCNEYGIMSWMLNQTKED